MTEYSRMAKGSFTATGTSGVVVLPFTPDYVELWNLTNIQASPAQNKVTRAWWDNKLLDASTPQLNPVMVELYPNGSSTFVSFDTIKNDASHIGINTFSAGLTQQFGAAQQIVSIAKSTTPTIVTLSAGHGFIVGDTIVMRGLFQSSTTGMPQINGIPFTIVAVTSTTVSINWDSSGSAYTALSASPASAFIYKVLYPFLYLPQDNVISAITLGATTTVKTTMYHNFEVGQEVAFRIPSQWGTVELNSLPNVLIPGSPIYGYVISITDNWTFVVNINSSSYTAYTDNIAVASVPGLTFPQVLAVGDVNTGGNVIFSGSSLYPPPRYPTSSNRVPTINGPAIRGAFVNNTSQGFIIGSGTAVTNTSATLMTTSDIIYWHAYFHDYGSP